MMYQLLYQYFITYNQLILPGTGTLMLEKNSATGDFAARLVRPPVYTVVFQANSEKPPTSFFNWLSAGLNTSVQEAVIRFNDFAFQLRQQIAAGDIIQWKGIGVLQKGLGAEARFTPDLTENAFAEPVIAEKVLRDKADHMVRVGEDQKTSAEMTAMLNKPEMQKSGWWIIALVLGILSLGFIGWHFYNHGFEPAATANSCKLVPMESADNNPE